MSGKSSYSYSLFPKSLSLCVEQVTKPLVKNHFKAFGSAGFKIITEWEAIAGPSLARHTFPEKISFPKRKTPDQGGGSLTVAVENGFATELQYMQPMLLERINSYFGYQAITRILVSKNHHSSPTVASVPSSKAPLQKLDYKASINAVEDDELKAALESLAQAFCRPNA